MIRAKISHLLAILSSGHTRTSLLRTLNSSGSFNADEWLLPETRQLFEKQAVRQKKLALGNFSSENIDHWLR